MHNQATHLEEGLLGIEKTMAASHYSYEITVVDDGLTDGPGELAETLGVRTIRLATNRASGSARKYGEPIRFFGPPAGLSGVAGVGKLVYDRIVQDSRIATNTVVILGLAVALAGVGLLAAWLVQLNKRDHQLIPATQDRPRG